MEQLLLAGYSRSREVNFFLGIACVLIPISFRTNGNKEERLMLSKLSALQPRLGTLKSLTFTSLPHSFLIGEV